MLHTLLTWAVTPAACARCACNACNARFGACARRGWRPHTAETCACSSRGKLRSQHILAKASALLCEGYDSPAQNLVLDTVLRRMGVAVSANHPSGMLPLYKIPTTGGRQRLGKAGSFGVWFSRFHCVQWLWDRYFSTGSQCPSQPPPPNSKTSP